MPRTSSASLSVIPFDGPQPRIVAPSGLSKAERTLFNEIVKAANPRHFAETDIPLLVSFVEASVMARRTARDRRLVH